MQKCGKLKDFVGLGNGMLKIIKTMAELDTKQLMSVYSEGNLENGEMLFGDLSADIQRIKAEDTFLSYLREDFFHQPDAVYAVWVEDNNYLSALRLEPYKDGLLLEALETAPNARRKGYACKLIGAVFSYLGATPWNKVYSHISKRNLPSIGVHKKCGFVQVSDCATYIDGTVTQNSATYCYEL